MKTCSQSVANYLLDKSNQDGKILTILPLMKLSYLVHGFSLALNDEPAFNPRFDRVEAWRYGPVIPSLYDEFKHNGDKPIKERSRILTFKGAKSFISEARLGSSSVKGIVDFVWSSFSHYTPAQLVDLTHAPGSPWDQVFVEGENRVIEDWRTAKYFRALIKVVREERYA